MVESKGSAATWAIENQRGAGHYLKAWPAENGAPRREARPSAIRVTQLPKQQSGNGSGNFHLYLSKKNGQVDPGGIV